MRPQDTSADAEAAQMAVYRRMGPERRATLALRMSDDARSTSQAGIRSRHPEYSDAEARHALNRLLLGDELFRNAWPDAPLLRP